MDESLFPPTISKKVGKRENSWSVQRERRELVGYSGHNRKSNDDWPHNQFFSVASYKTNQIEGSLVAANPLNDFGCDRNGVIVIDCERAQFFFSKGKFFGFGRRKLMVWLQPSGLLLLVVVVVV